MSSGDKTNAETATINAISQRKLEANRENAKKSTGPRTSQGKNTVRFNAERHGLCSKLMFAAGGEPLDNGIKERVEALHDRYGRGDPFTELLIELIANGVWRLARSQAGEMGHFSDTKRFPQPHWAFDPQGGRLPLIERYRVSNERALIKAFETLEKLHPQPPQVLADPDDSSEDDLLALSSRDTEVGPDEELSTATLAAPNSQTSAAEIDEAPKPVVTSQVAGSPEVASGREQLEASPRCDDPATASPTVPTQIGVRLDDEQVA